MIDGKTVAQADNSRNGMLLSSAEEGLYFSAVMSQEILFI